MKPIMPGLDEVEKLVETYGLREVLKTISYVAGKGTDAATGQEQENLYFVAQQLYNMRALLKKPDRPAEGQWDVGEYQSP